MSTRASLAFFLLLAVQGVSQHRLPPAQTQCRFSDGTKIKVSYSHERQSYLFRTDGGLITINGIRLPSGDYIISVAKDAYNNWTLRMRRSDAKRTDRLTALPLSMAAATNGAAVDSFPFVFEQTGGSCKMQWKQNDYMSLALEFTRGNADVPLLNLVGH